MVIQWFTEFSTGDVVWPHHMHDIHMHEFRYVSSGEYRSPHGKSCAYVPAWVTPALTRAQGGFTTSFFIGFFRIFDRFDGKGDRTSMILCIYIYISESIFSYYTSNPKAVVCFTFHLPLGVLTRQLLQRRLQKHLVSKSNNMGRVFGCSFPRGVWKHLHPVQGKKSMVLNKSVKEACMSFVAMTRYQYMIIYIYVYTENQKYGHHMKPVFSTWNKPGHVYWEPHLSFPWGTARCWKKL